MAKFTRKGFVAWLRSVPARKVVGRRAQASCCPIARYLGPGYRVERLQFRSLTDYSMNLPDWAVSFVRTVDHSGRRGSNITAAFCLKALGEDRDG